MMTLSSYRIKVLYLSCKCRYYLVSSLFLCFGLASEMNRCDKVAEILDQRQKRDVVHQNKVTYL